MELRVAGAVVFDRVCVWYEYWGGGTVSCTYGLRGVCTAFVVAYNVACANAVGLREWERWKCVKNDRNMCLRWTDGAWGSSVVVLSVILFVRSKSSRRSSRWRTCRSCCCCQAWNWWFCWEIKNRHRGDSCGWSNFLNHSGTPMTGRRIWWLLRRHCLIVNWQQMQSI